MIFPYMDEKELNTYLSSQINMLKDSVSCLDHSWNHSRIIRDWCEYTIEYLQKLYSERCDSNDSLLAVGSKTEKYTKWVEVMRLAFFHYARFTERKLARSEGLYSTLVSLASIWKPEQVDKIIIPGCGPGRSVLDFARVFPNTEVVGLDYSALALALGEQIVCTDKSVSLLQRDVCSGDSISKEYTVKGFCLTNASFGIANLITSSLPECDMIVCSNTVNLLPDHEIIVQKMSSALRSGGIIIFADLIGWRLDRESGRRLLCDDRSIRTAFENCGIQTLDMFSGVPYIENESDDQETCYNEHFYVGRKLK